MVKTKNYLLHTFFLSLLVSPESNNATTTTHEQAISILQAALAEAKANWKAARLKAAEAAAAAAALKAASAAAGEGAAAAASSPSAA